MKCVCPDGATLLYVHECRHYPPKCQCDCHTSLMGRCGVTSCCKLAGSFMRPGIPNLENSDPKIIFFAKFK